MSIALKELPAISSFESGSALLLVNGVLRRFEMSGLVGAAERLTDVEEIVNDLSVRVSTLELGTGDNLEERVTLVENRVTALESAPVVSGLPVGAVVGLPFESIPDGFLLCDGQAVSRVDYAALFALLGDTFGAGDGATTFHLPDYRGRSLLGAGQGDGLTARTLGEIGGEEEHVLTVGEMPSHSHKFLIAANNVAISYHQLKTQNCNNTRNRASSSAGGSQPHNTMMPFAVAHWMIKY